MDELTPKKAETSEISTLENIEKFLPPGYKTIEVIGEGGMGKVFKVFNATLNRIEALKLLKIKDDRTRELLKRFQREAQSLAALKRHSRALAIPEIFLCQLTQNNFFYTMEYVEGVSLYQLIEERKIDIQQAIKYTRDLANTLQVIHLKGILHRDIKPANIIIDKDNCPWLVDFGIAKIIEETTNITQNSILGTPSYISPEHASTTHKFDQRSDIYSLGTVFYEMLTFEKANQGETMVQILFEVFYENPKTPSQIVKGLDKKLEQICLKALQKKAENRYQTALEFCQELENFTSKKQLKTKKGFLIYLQWVCTALFLAIATIAIIIFAETTHYPQQEFYSTSLLKVSGGFNRSWESWRPINRTSKLKPGDYYQLYLETKEKLYLSIWQIDGIGTPILCFPLPKTQSLLKNPVDIGKYILPHPQSAFRLDNKPGPEKLYFFYSLSPMPVKKEFYLDLIKKLKTVKEYPAFFQLNSKIYLVYFHFYKDVKNHK